MSMKIFRRLANKGRIQIRKVLLLVWIMVLSSCVYVCRLTALLAAPREFVQDHLLLLLQLVSNYVLLVAENSCSTLNLNVSGHIMLLLVSSPTLVIVVQVAISQVVHKCAIL